MTPSLSWILYFGKERAFLLKGPFLAFPHKIFYNKY